MTLPIWHEEPITKKHYRDSFDCADNAINNFFHRHARKSHEKGGAKTFVAINSEDNKTILGFYSLSPASIAYNRSPEIIRKGLARHEIPVFRLARLAIDKSYQNKGLGGQLLLTAGRRCLYVAAQAGGVALLIDAKCQQTANWYKGYGAIPLVDAPLSLLLPFKTIHAALAAAGKLDF